MPRAVRSATITLCAGAFALSACAASYDAATDGTRPDARSATDAFAVPAPSDATVSCMPMSATQPDAAIDACGGARPAFDSCVHGATWAECGGVSGEPRFACNGDCYWFANGCVAAGFVESPCPADCLCCVATGGSRGGTGVGTVNGLGVATLTAGWGTAPWDRTRDASLDVHVGTPSTGARPSVACTSTADFPGVCTTPGQPMLVRLGSVHGVWVVRLRDNRYAIASTELFIEVITGRGGNSTARVCIVPTTDVAGPDQCQPQRGQACAVRGTITIPSFPTSDDESRTLPIDVDAVMPDGSLMMLRL